MVPNIFVTETPNETSHEPLKINTPEIEVRETVGVEKCTYNLA